MDFFHRHWPFGRSEGRRKKTEELCVTREEEEEEEEPEIVEEAEFLLIESVDRHLEENRKNHKTDEYENENLLVLRRGDVVKFTVHSNRKPKLNEEIWFRLAYGKVPKLSNGTLIEVTSSKKRDVDGDWWLEKVEEEKSGSITYHLHIPPTAPVARYNLTVDSWVIENSKYVKKSSWPKPGCGKITLVVLFNPWCPEDQVYLDNEEEREEYVLNDHGRVWVGSPKSSRPWYFAQFEDECYEVALDILSFVGYFENRSDASLICRNFSNLVSAQILQGRWFTPYSPYTSPTDWTGSQKILKNFKQRKVHVKFGQCWVFSAVTTTLCRALGIPTRTVTNFQSAHDTDRSVTIDYHFDIRGKPLEDLNSDSVWNFHVWNEAWMKRRDLPDGYDGWQAFDATPQETSEIGGQIACGPCPLSAIKEGELHIPYDGKFIFSEVNGDQCYWIQNSRGKFDLHKVEHSGIGTSIITKGMGRGNRDGVDLRSLYKHKDGSNKETEVLNRAYGHSSKRTRILAAMVDNKNVIYKFEVEPAETVKAGETIYASLSTENSSKKPMELQVTISVGAFYYYGRPMSQSCKTFRGKVELQSEEKKELRLSLKPDDYLQFVKEDAQLRFYCVAESLDRSASGSFVGAKQINLDLPEVVIEALSETKVKSGDPVSLKMKFENPLKESLTDVEFTVEGAGMRQRSFKPGKDLPPGETIILTVEARPRRKGKREIVASFRSEEMSSQAAAIDVEVE